MANTPQSRKNRGRKFQKKVREMIIDTFPLEEDDVRSTSMGASGEDLLMSPLARKYFPFSIECKDQERTSIWEWWSQTKANATHKPLLIFRRNREEPLAVIRFEDLLELLKNEDRNDRH